MTRVTFRLPQNTIHEWARVEGKKHESTKAQTRVSGSHDVLNHYYNDGCLVWEVITVGHKQNSSLKQEVVMRVWSRNQTEVIHTVQQDRLRHAGTWWQGINKKSECVCVNPAQALLCLAEHSMYSFLTVSTLIWNRRRSSVCFSSTMSTFSVNIKNSSSQGAFNLKL